MLHKQKRTSKRLSAKCSVQDDLAFLWKHVIFRPPLNENLLTDHYEIFPFKYDGETTELAENGNNRFDRRGSPDKWNISILYLTFLFFFTGPTDQTTEPICTYNRSNDADWPRPYLFRVSSKQFFSQGNIRSPTNPKGTSYANLKVALLLNGEN